MKYLFTAPRYHTNQVPVVKGLKGMGHEVRYFVAFVGITEDHSFCEPILLKPSKTTARLKKKLEKKKDASTIESIIAGHFIPDYKDLKEKFLEYKPDVVIARDKTFLTLFVYGLCLEYNIPCILYNQEPLYPLKKNQVKQKRKTASNVHLFSRIQNKLNRKLNPDLRRVYANRDTIGFPQIRMTPVQYRRMPKELSETTSQNMSYFVPFVAERVEKGLGRKYCEEGIIHILSVGKFRDYKNLPILIEAGKQLNNSSDFAWHMTIIGQVSNADEKKYYADIVQRITLADLDDKITIKTNIPHEKMEEEYLRNDLFILSSKKETASISVLEAMAHGLAVISTDYNGTASYIDEGQTGFVFETENAVSLENAIRSAQAYGIEKLGKKARETALEQYSWKRYYNLLQIVVAAAKSVS